MNLAAIDRTPLAIAEPALLEPVEDGRDRCLAEVHAAGNRADGHVAEVADCLKDQQLRRCKPCSLGELPGVEVRRPHDPPKGDQHVFVAFRHGPHSL